MDIFSIHIDNSPVNPGSMLINAILDSNKCTEMKRVLPIVFLLTLLYNSGFAQKTYSIDISDPSISTIHTPLNLGGSNPDDDSISVNNDFISFNNRPFFPVMGEFHFSRYPLRYWEEAILKMKAGGINIIATYVFWILHEPKENKFNWEGDRNLKAFAALCAKHKIWLVVRVGPYGHGEIRNGAIPDWLYGRPINIRTDDPAYLSIIERYFGQIATQLNGYFYKDGGPVIGIQLENEYQHAGSAWWLNYPNAPIQYSFPESQRHLTKNNTFNTANKEIYKASGDEHMLTLKKIAREAGLITPLYTATGWGYAAIAEKESLPVSAAYAFPSWGNLEASPFYLFKDLRKDPDYGPIRYNPLQYPSLSAEIGSGIMITTSKRPRVPLNSFTPLMIRNIGSGSNGIGYYMYHGGSTPVLDGQFMSEEPGELPKISYDFQAPISEFGQIRASYKELKPLHFFLQSYGSQLAPMAVTIPSTNPTNPTDQSTLRYTVRSNGREGFVFLHNYQDHAERIDLNGLQISIKTKNSNINIPSTGSFTLQKEKSVIFPFNLPFNNGTITYATVQPMTSFTKNGIQYHVFISQDGIQPEFNLQTKGRLLPDKNCRYTKKNGTYLLRGKNNEIFSFSINSFKYSNQFLVIPMSMATNAYKYQNGLVFTNETLLLKEDEIELICREKNTNSLLFFPAINKLPEIEGATIQPVHDNALFSTYAITFTAKKPSVEIKQPMPANTIINLGDNFLDGLNDVYLKIDYTGDKAQLLSDGKLIGDHFYYGAPWEIGLKRFATEFKNKPLYLYFLPIRKDAPCLAYFDKQPPFGMEEEYLKINSIKIIPEYKCIIRLNP